MMQLACKQILGTWEDEFLAPWALVEGKILQTGGGEGQWRNRDKETHHRSWPAQQHAGLTIGSPAHLLTNHGYFMWSAQLTAGTSTRYSSTSDSGKAGAPDLERRGPCCATAVSPSTFSTNITIVFPALRLRAQSTLSECGQSPGSLGVSVSYDNNDNDLESVNVQLTHC